MIKSHITKNCEKYTPKNRAKYKGQYPIISRSSWETKFCAWCDANKSVLYWSSEPLAINYFNPIMQKEARYYPDFLLKINNKNGKTDVLLVEVKPFKETHQPSKHGNKKKSTILYEQKTWKINEAKWKAAQRYCKLKGWKFKLITENELFGK